MPIPGFGEAVGGAECDPLDRADLLNLIGLYSHLADALETERWAEVFTQDASFTIHPPGSTGDAGAPIVWRGRDEIVAAMAPRHAGFREGRVQRRHFLTNPIVWEQTANSARIAAYLQLVSTTDGAAAELVGTARYEGRAVKTRGGWRVAEWVVYSDQRLA